MTSTPISSLIVAAAIIHTPPTSPAMVLAAQRSYPPLLAGQWEFPGGKVEPGETPQKAVIREIREELNIDITLGSVIPGPRAGYWPLSDEKVMRLWAARTHQTPTRGSSHSALRWLCADDIESVPWLPGDLQILPAIRSLLEAENSPTSPSFFDT